MTAYMIAFAKINDRQKFIEEYGQPTADVIRKFGGEYLVRTPKVETLEGIIGDGQSAVISKWPDAEAIRRFWTSPEYEKLKAARQPLADCNIFIVEPPA
ncbi:MAG: DUF1330 domain-containing protein [Pseudomonadota bacterium]